MSITAKQVIGEVFDADNLEPNADGTLTLPGWMGYVCASEGTTVQTSAETLATGFPANAVRALSLDGETWSALGEPGRANLLSSQDLTDWLGSSPAALSSTTGPDGSTGDYLATDDDAGAAERLVLSGAEVDDLVAAAAYTLQTWLRIDSGPGATMQANPIAHNPNTPAINEASTSGWEHFASSAVSGDGSGGDAQIDFFPTTTTASATGAAAIFGMQLEQAGHASSFYTGVREAGIYFLAVEAVVRDGYFHLRVQVLVGFNDTDNGVGGAFTVFHLSDDTWCVYDADTQELTLSVGGEVLTLTGITFDSWTVLDVEAEHGPRRRRLVLTGALTGDGEQVGAPVDPLTDLPAIGYAIGSTAGCEKVAGLRKFIPNLTTFCGLAEERLLSQMACDAPDREFVDLMCVLASGRARAFDTAIMVRSIFETKFAYGAMLDVIGSIVGLPREGFEDDRYRVFLDIQIELLLSSARESSEWTGTCESLLRICRKFIGEAADPIELRNHPPYSYENQVPGIVIDEAYLLARFLSKANYAAVRGLLIVLLTSTDYAWESDISPLTDAGVWESDISPIAGALTWQSVVET